MFRYYNILVKRLKSALKSGASNEEQITKLGWKRAFPNRDHTHGMLWNELGVTGPTKAPRTPKKKGGKKQN